MTIRLMRTFSISSYVILSPEITRSPSSAENALSQSMLIAASYLCLCSMAVLHCAFVQGALMPTKAYSVSGALSCSGRSFQNSPLRECFVSQKAFRKSHSTPRHDGFHETRDVALQNFLPGAREIRRCDYVGRGSPWSNWQRVLWSHLLHWHRLL